MLKLFADNLLPVFLAAALGYLFRAKTRIDPKPVTQIAFNVLAPCLIFRLIAENGVTGLDFLRTLGFTTAVLLTLGGLALLIARWRGWSRSLTAAVVLTVMLPNAGNFGLSANLLAFGSEGLREASLFFVSSSILTYTVGVFVASLGRLSTLEALKNLAGVPALWAVPAAFLTSASGLELPVPLNRTLHLLSDACIPIFLLLLGMQLYGARWKGRAGPLATASALRLAGGLALSLALANLLRLEGVERQSLVFQSSMPTAVVTIILASEYDAEPDFVTSVVLITTLLCPFTLTPLLAWLKAWHVG